MKISYSRPTKEQRITIAGVNIGKPLTKEHIAWYEILIEIKFKEESAGEHMMQDFESKEWAVKQDVKAFSSCLQNDIPKGEYGLS